ncbi:hypothetical protein [Agrobacterium cavarae]
MVQLGPILRKHQFEHGLRMLEKGYKAARDSFENEIKRIEAEAKAYEDSGEWIGEVDDEGYTLWEQSQVYDLQIEDIHSASFEVRKAFTIALYHFWEDSVARWMGLNGRQASHEEMELYCSHEGYGPSPDLGAVRCLANHLKHGRNSRNDWLVRLRTEYPSFLPPARSNIVGLSEQTLFKVAAVIFASGPTVEN